MIAIFLIFFVTIDAVLVFSISTQKAAAREIEAAYLAQEAMEAIKNVRNQSWTTGIAALTKETAYYPVLVGVSWTLSPVDPGLINGRYTRSVVMSAAYRNPSNNLSSSGVEDALTRLATVRVSWLERGAATKEVVIKSYVTNFLAN